MESFHIVGFQVDSKLALNYVIPVIPPSNSRLKRQSSTRRTDQTVLKKQKKAWSYLVDQMLKVRITSV